MCYINELVLSYTEQDETSAATKGPKQVAALDNTHMCETATV